MLYKFKFGEAGYNMANEFLDAFSHYKNVEDHVFLTINWDDWHEVGMSVKAAKKQNQRLSKEESLSSWEGVEVLNYVLANRLSQVIVSPIDLTSQIKQQDVLIEDFLSAKKELHSRPKLDNEYIPPRNETEQRLAEIWQKCLGIEKIGIHDNFFELGGDSLLALQVISKIRSEMDIELPLQPLFEVATIKGLSEKLVNFEKDRPYVEIKTIEFQQITKFEKENEVKGFEEGTL